MVSVLVRKSRINGSIRCPSSKSYTHRAISVASLAHGESTITNVLMARDTLATVAGCCALGAQIKSEGSTLWVNGSNFLNPPENVVNAENSGTTIRIMTAMSALIKRGYTILTGDQSLRRRPMQPILDALIQLGVQAHSSKENGTPPIIVRGGGIKGGTTSIDGTVSSQFVSGILIAGIQADSNIIMKVKGDLISKPYVLATLAIMKHFGGPVDHTQDMLEYYIKSARYNSTQFEIPSDFSSAALILAAGVLVGEKIQLNGLSFTLPQGDSQIIEILQRMGCRIMVDRMNGDIQIDGSEHLDGGNFNLADTPDLLPVVSVLALKAKSPVTIKGVAHARLKETDRIANLAKELVKFGASIEELPDGLKIMAPFDIKNASLQAYNDHRLFMALTIASMMTQKSIVAGAESVDVSYPNFLSDMRALGADISPAPDRE